MPFTILTVNMLTRVGASFCFGYAAPALVAGNVWTFPIVAGMLAGCGGLFLPCDRGLSPLADGVPWAVQSAVYGAVVYCGLGGGDVETGRWTSLIVPCGYVVCQITSSCACVYVCVVTTLKDQFATLR